MKWRFFNILILTVWFAGSVFRGTAQPNWELNPQNFEYSMTVTGRVNIDGIFSVDGDDMVAAFVNGECRGITKLTYENFVNEYYVYLMIYSNSVTEVLTFKIFDASANEIKTTNNTLDFVVNNIVGSMDSPFIFSTGELSSEAKILNFNIPNQIGESVIDANTIRLKGSSNSSLTEIVAGFSASEGAKVFVEGIEQVSNVTTNDFSSPVIYMIVSANLSDTTFYTVNVVPEENNSPSAIYLSNIFISESAELFTIVAVIKAEDLDLFDSHVFSLMDGNGVNDSENSFFRIVGDNLILTQSLNFEDKQKLNVLIRGTDSKGAFIEEPLVLQVTDANDPPTAIKLSNTLVSESTDPNSIVAIIDVEDLDLSDTHQIDLIEGNGINDAQNSYFRIVGNNLILVQSLDFEVNQFLKVLIRVKDSGGAVLEESVVLKVTNENDPPKFNSTPTSYIFQGEIFVYPILITDVDNDPINISFENLPYWISYNANSKFISGVPGNEEVGDYNFKIRASDGQFESVQIVSFTVINVNDPPEINNYISNQQFLSNRYNEIQLPHDCIIDPDADDELIFNLSTDNNTALPEWLSFNKETLTISGTPPMGTQTAIKLKLIATDKGKLKEWIAFELLVSIPTAVNVEENINLFTVYPNPVSEKLHIVLPQGKEKANVNILNFTGQVLQQFTLDAGSINTVSLGSLPPGVYFVCLAQGNIKQIRKIVKE